MTIREDVPLAPYTTFRIGGPAQFFVETSSEEEIDDAVQFAESRDLPLTILGGGSNVLIADAGVPGLVLRPLLTDVREEGPLVHAGAGVVWDDFVQWAIAHKRYGLESLSGVPGSVGGGVVQNVGCYGQQLSDTLASVRVLDRVGRTIKTLSREECGFSYHESRFGREQGRYIVLSAAFSLKREFHVATYADSRFDMATLAANLGRAPGALDIRDLVLRVREQKGTLEHCYKSAGSFFHMPFVSKEAYAHVLDTARTLDPAKEERLRPWAWEQADGSYKLAPGFLLEYTEFQKGYVRGNVGISPKHTLTIINRDNASADEVAALARDMQESVHTIFSIDLEREVEYVGTK